MCLPRPTPSFCRRLTARQRALTLRKTFLVCGEKESRPGGRSGRPTLGRGLRATSEREKAFAVERRRSSKGSGGSERWLDAGDTGEAVLEKPVPALTLRLTGCCRKGGGEGESWASWRNGQGARRVSAGAAAGSQRKRPRSLTSPRAPDGRSSADYSGPLSGS